MSGDIQQNAPVFLAVSYLTFSTELHYLGSYQAEVRQILHDIAASSPLLARSFRQWYCNSFLNDSAKNTSCISRRSWHFPKIISLPWQRPSINRKTRYRSIICTQSGFIWWKGCKNWSSIWLNMPFLPCRKKVCKWAPFYLELLDQRWRHFYAV